MTKRHPVVQKFLEPLDQDGRKYLADKVLINNTISNTNVNALKLNISSSTAPDISICFNNLLIFC